MTEQNTTRHETQNSGGKRFLKALAAGLRPDPETAGGCQGCGNCHSKNPAGQEVTVDRAKIRAIIERIADAQSAGVTLFEAMAYSRHLMEPGCFDHVVNDFDAAMTDLYWVLEVLKAEAGLESEAKGKWDLPA